MLKSRASQSLEPKPDKIFSYTNPVVEVAVVVVVVVVVVEILKLNFTLISKDQNKQC